MTLVNYFFLQKSSLITIVDYLVTDSSDGFTLIDLQPPTDDPISCRH